MFGCRVVVCDVKDVTYVSLMRMGRKRMEELEHFTKTVLKTVKIRNEHARFAAILLLLRAIVVFCFLRIYDSTKKPIEHECKQKSFSIG